MNKISLIIPVYNKAKYIRRCLDSVENQSDPNAQVIIVDDESTDGSGEICKEYASRLGWCYCRIKHSGVAVARNCGMALAEGKYITFLDADDALTEDAIDVMNRISRHGFNIYQFGQYRCHSLVTYKDQFRKGFYDLNGMPRRWPMVWNKLYKASFLKRHHMRFIDGMQFGEDEVFNVQCILANGGLYHAPQTLIRHYFDDKQSLCRGELDLARLERLIEELRKLQKRQNDPAKAQWIARKIAIHESSPLFARFGYKAPHTERKPTGKYDIVYLVKNSYRNEELRYSLRSVEANWKYKSVWFYGGCPEGLKPDHYVAVKQFGDTKWQRVRNMMVEVCTNDSITEDFWLFNDDFFVLKPKPENMKPLYNTTLEERIKKIEGRHGGIPTDYTKPLRHLVKTLKNANKGTLDYAVHKPMLINRKKMLEVLERFPDEPMMRALYGNYWNIGGTSRPDMKIQLTRWNGTANAMREWDFVSTSDASFQNGDVGRYLRDKFKTPSRFEV